MYLHKITVYIADYDELKSEIWKNMIEESLNDCDVIPFVAKCFTDCTPMFNDWDDDWDINQPTATIEDFEIYFNDNC